MIRVFPGVYQFSAKMTLENGMVGDVEIYCNNIPMKLTETETVDRCGISEVSCAVFASSALSNRGWSLKSAIGLTKDAKGCSFTPSQCKCENYGFPLEDLLNRHAIPNIDTVVISLYHALGLAYSTAHPTLTVGPTPW